MQEFLQLENGIRAPGDPGDPDWLATTLFDSGI
jgi:hypothetical protein